jgi:hypothetical protein
LVALTAFIEAVHAEPELSHSAATMLYVQRALTFSAFFVAYSLLLTIIYATGADLTVKPPRFHPGYLKLFISIAILQVGASSYALAKIQAALRTSARGKARLLKEFEQAKTKLQTIVNKVEKAHTAGQLE